MKVYMCICEGFGLYIFYFRLHRFLLLKAILHPLKEAMLRHLKAMHRPLKAMLHPLREVMLHPLKAILHQIKAILHPLKAMPSPLRAAMPLPLNKEATNLLLNIRPLQACPLHKGSCPLKVCRPLRGSRLLKVCRPLRGFRPLRYSLAFLVDL